MVVGKLDQSVKTNWYYNFHGVMNVTAIFLIFFLLHNFSFLHSVMGVRTYLWYYSILRTYNFVNGCIETKSMVPYDIIRTNKLLTTALLALHPISRQRTYNILTDTYNG